MAFFNSTQNVSLSGGISTGITALAGGANSALTPLLGAISVIGTCATAADSVAIAAGLPAGSILFVRNNGAAAANIFPPTGGTINGGAANAAVSLTNAKGAILVCTDSTGAGLTWVTAALAA